MSRTASQIIDDVARAFDVSRDDMISDWRSPVVAIPRFAAMHMLRNERELTYPVIARMMARKDHTTVISGVRRAEKLLATDPSFAESFARARG